VRPIGRRAFLAGAAVTGTALAVGGLGDTAHAIEPGAGYFQALDPRRLCDTRTGRGYRRVDANTIRVKVAGLRGVPANATAAVITLTMVNRRSGGNWLAAYPAGTTWGGTSNVNGTHYDHAVANLVTVKLGPSGSTKGWIEVRSLGPTEVVVDLAGVYVPTAVPVAAGRFVGRADVVRAIDTRNLRRKPRAGDVVHVDLSGLVPADATAVVANLTVDQASGPGYFTAFPRGARRPPTSNVNVNTGDTRAAAIMTKIGRSSTGAPGISVYTMRGGHVIVDVAGYITGPSAGASGNGLFVAIQPRRILDTRADRRRLWPGWTRASTLPAPMNTRAQAVVMNLTVTRTMGAGFFTMLPAQTPRRVVSNLNVTGPEQTVANQAVVRASRKGIACYSQRGAHVVFDLTGWYTGAPVAATTGVPVNPNPPPAQLPWRVEVPRMGLANSVFGGAPDPIVDAGHSWHWTGTGLVGELSRHVVLFGHRTEGPAPWYNGGVYRYQHELRAGDLMYIYTADNRVFTYRMVAEYLTSKYTNDILDATRRIGGETVSLVACTQPNRLPTNVNYRLISTFLLVEWADLG
jgi:hypothetical protein